MMLGSVFRFKYFNKYVFRDRLPPDLSLTWSPHLTRTAGQTLQTLRNISSNVSGQMGKECSVKLSTKVLDTEEKLACTLLHELCHVAQCLLEDETKPAHGPGFKKWCARLLLL